MTYTSQSTSQPNKQLCSQSWKFPDYHHHGWPRHHCLPLTRTPTSSHPKCPLQGFRPHSPEFQNQVSLVKWRGKEDWLLSDGQVVRVLPNNNNNFPISRPSVDHFAYKHSVGMEGVGSINSNESKPITEESRPPRVSQLAIPMSRPLAQRHHWQLMSGFMRSFLFHSFGFRLHF